MHQRLSQTASYGPRILALLAAALLAACGGGGGAEPGGGGGGGGGPTDPPFVDQRPPSVSVSTPGGPVASLPGDTLPVEFKADDDADAEVRVVLDVDGDSTTTFDQVVLFTGTDENGAPASVDGDTSGAAPGRYTLFVIVDDGTNPPVADGGQTVMVYPGLAGVAAPRSIRYGVAGEVVVFSVGEAEQGGTDLDADGDAGDGVACILDLAQGKVDQTASSVDVSPVGLIPTAQILPSDGLAIFWHRREADEGRNLNPDADFIDTVVAYTAPALGVIGPTTNPTGGAVLTNGFSPGFRMVRFDEKLHGADLNGDRDALDEVVLTLDASLNMLRGGGGPEMRPGTPYVSRGQYGVYLCDEASQGPLNLGADLNLDFDMLDTLLVVTDALTGVPLWVSTSNVDPLAAIAAPASWVIAPTAGYYVDESLASPGASLNGDLDSTDFVPALGTGPESFPLVTPFNAGAGAQYVFCGPRTVVHLAGEEGLFDLNGDGDRLDTKTLHWVDTVGPPTWKPLIPLGTSLTGLALDGGSAAHLTADWLGLAVAESANGRVFNADGDQLDFVFMLVDLTGSQPVVHNTGIVPASPATLPLPGSTIPITGVGGPSGVVIQAAETANGDLNADGDATDTLLVYFDFSAPTTPIVLADTGAMHATIAGGIIATTAYEALTATDLNGDGDATDFLLRCFDLTGAVVERGLLCDQHSVPANGGSTLWAYLRSESAEQRYLNADADMVDVVLGLWRP